MEEVVEVGAQEIPIEPLPEEEDVDMDVSQSETFESDFGDYLLEKRRREERGEKEKLEEEEELSSPIRTEWPADTLLKPSHFTIDSQRCLNCCVELGYAMPMNRTPNPKYLFCQDKDECKTAQLLKCWACGNFNSERSGHIVSRPGNSAFQGPSSIFSFMCDYCYKEQCALEPSYEETKEMFAKYREVRRENELKEADKYDFLASTGGTQGGYPPPPCHIQSPAVTGRKRKKMSFGTEDDDARY
jgi:hypothetical protein